MSAEPGPSRAAPRALASAAGAAIALTALLWIACVLWPSIAAARALSMGGAVPETFDGARTLLATLGWSAATALGCALLGWIVGRAIRGARGGAWLLAGSIVVAALPPYAVFWTWWEASGPGSMLGDWIESHGWVVGWRQTLLAVGLLSWGWPVVAWAVAARDARDEAQQRELARLEGEAWTARLARAWRSDRSALALGTAVAFFMIAGSTVTFDLAQVPTYGFELRTLDVQGTPAGVVLRAGWPAIAIAAAGALVLGCWPTRPREETPAAAAPTRAWLAWTVLTLALLLPLATLLRALLLRGALADFGPIALRGAAGTFAAAAGAGALAAAVACGHLALVAAGARRTERALLAGWILAAAVPGTIAALALGAAYNSDMLGPPVYDTPAIMVLAHLARFGVVAAWLGRSAALREPRERRDLRAIDGGGLRGLLPALAPQAALAALAAALAVTTLGAGEVVVAGRLEPPGWEWTSQRLLNAIHYQQPATVLGALLALLVVAGAAAAVLVLALRRSRALLAGLLLLALLPLAPGGCREQTDAGGETGPALAATRWFGAPGRGRGQFEYPRVLEVDPRDGTIIVVDRQARLQRFSPEGKWLAEWAMPEKASGKPTGIGIGPDGTVYVADTHYHRVIVFSPEGKELRRWGQYGMEPGQFIFPCDAEIGPDGLLYVAEFGGNDRIQVFTPEGAFVRTFGRHGRGNVEFDRPQSLGFSPDGTELFVTDACNHRIQVLTREGAFLRSFGTVGSAPGQLVYPYGLEVLPDGSLLVAEFGDNRIQRVDPRDGRCLALAGAVVNAPTPLTIQMIDGDRVRSIPSAANALRFPWAVGAHDGTVYVLDSGHSRVLAAPLESLPKPAVR